MGKTDEAKTKNETAEEKVARWLGRMAESARERYEGRKAKMLAALDRDPVNAIEWESNEMVAAQTAYYEVWRAVEQELKEHPAGEVLKEAIATTTDKVGWTLGGGSTCPYHRAVERTKGEILFRELCKLREFAGHLDDQD